MPQPLVGATFMIAAAHATQLPSAGPPEIAFAGRSNSGKSSAINALARRTRLAFSSRTPGRTREIVFFELRSRARVADLPGYGYAAVPHAVKAAWQALLWRYVTERSTLVALVLVVDARHGVKPPDLELLAAFVGSARPVLILATKSDKLTDSATRASVAAITHEVASAFPGTGANVHVIAFSATRRVGVENAEALIDAWLFGSA